MIAWWLLLTAADVHIVARKEWDLNPPRSRRVHRPLKWIVVHHSDFPDTPGPLALTQYHREVRGFSDIGYHFIISPDGTTYEGRHIQAIGAHAGITREQGKNKALDPDYSTIGIVLDGEYTASDPPEAQAEALIALVTHLRNKYRIKADHVIGHRDVKPLLIDARGLTFVGELKVCPGDGAQKLVDQLRQQK